MSLFCLLLISNNFLLEVCLYRSAIIFMPFQPLNISEIYTADTMEVKEAWDFFCRLPVFTNIFINHPEFYSIWMSLLNNYIISFNPKQCWFFSVSNFLNVLLLLSFFQSCRFVIWDWHDVERRIRSMHKSIRMVSDSLFGRTWWLKTDNNLESLSLT